MLFNHKLFNHKLFNHKLFKVKTNASTSLFPVVLCLMLCVVYVLSMVSAQTATTIGDKVWIDSNHNYAFDVTESGMANVAVDLYDSTTKLIVDSTTTDSNGNFSFSRIITGSGSFYLDFTIPALVLHSFVLRDPNGNLSSDVDSDVNPTNGRTDSFTVLEGVNKLDIDAGVHPNADCKGEAFGFVFEDSNANGTHDALEPLLSGVSVVITDSEGTAFTVTTDSNGAYSQVITPGIATVLITTSTLPSGLDQSAGTNPSQVFVEPTTGGTGRFNAGFDGFSSSETTVSVTKTDAIQANTGSSALEPNETLRYTIEVTNNSAVSALKTLLTDTPDPNTTLVVGSVTTTVGSVTTGNTAGNKTVAVNIGDLAGSASATITFDVKLNNTLAVTVTEVSNQASVSGNNFVSVVSNDPDTTAAGDATTTTVSDAKIGIAKNLISQSSNINGTYTVTYSLLVENLGNATLSNLQITDDLGATFTGATAISIDSITSTDFTEDANYKGLGTARTLLTGVDTLGVGATGTVKITATVTLPTTSGLGPFNNSASATGTTPQSVAISDTSQNGTNPDPDNNNTAYDNNDATPVTFTALATASLGDKVFKDANGNGLQDTGESGVDGVVVNLWTDDDSDGTPDTKIQTVTTANGGMYSFTALDSTLDYILQFEGMAAMAFTLQDQGADDALDSDVNSSGLTAVINLAAGENNTSLDAGMMAVDTTLTVTKFDVVRNESTGASDMLEPEEVVAYAVEISNTSTVAAKDVVFTDTPDSNTTLQNTVATSQGTVTTGNTAGDTTIEVAVGDIAPGEKILIQFNAKLNNPIAATVTEISNQGSVSGSNIPTTLTDDPNTAVVADATLTPVSDPRIGLSKAVVGTPTANADGSHSVTYAMTMVNMGNRPLNNLQVTDDLGSTFVGGPSILDASVSSATLAANGNYTGLTDTNLLAGTDSLAVGASASLTLTVNVRLNTGPLGPYNNSAVTSGTSPESITVSDTSQDGSEVDPDNNSNPYDNNVVTPVTFTEAVVAPVGASVALAKAATLTKDIDSTGASIYRIVYDFIVANDSAVAVDAVQVTDDLVATTNGLAFAVIGSSTSANLSVNPNFNGNSDKNLLTGTNTLPAGASGTIKLEISISASFVTEDETLINSATMTATGPADTGVSDISQNGSNADPEGNGATDNSEPTIVRLEPETTTPTTPTTPTAPSTGQVRVQKVVLTPDYQIGTAITYRITLINDNTAGPAISSITDTPDKFLRYIPNSTEVRRSGLTTVETLEPTLADGALTWNNVVVAKAAPNNTGAVDSAQVEITYKMRVLPGASGKLRNSATVTSNGTTSEPAVNVNADILPGGAGPFSGLPTGTVLGRVFADVDGDKMYTAGVDQPIAGARIILCNGWQVRTDVEGNYTFREVPQGTDCVQLDKHSIPFEVDKSNLSSGSGYVQMMNSFGVSTNTFVLKQGTGEVKALRETTVVYGPVTVIKRHVALENGNVRVELDVEVSQELPYSIIITDRIPNPEQPTVFELATTREFELGVEAKHYDFNYELPKGSPMTDLELAPKK